MQVEQVALRPKINFLIEFGARIGHFAANTRVALVGQKAQPRLLVSDDHMKTAVLTLRLV